MRSPLHPTVDDLQAFAVSSLVVAAAFLAFRDLSFKALPFVIFTSALVIFSRELGQRLVAQWMDAYIDLELSHEGSITSIVGAGIAFLTGLPIILLFPLTSSFSGKKYEHWGKSVDAIWAKRQYWLIMGGLTTLFLSWLLAYSFDLQAFAELSSLFMFFQMMPFDYKAIPTGKLDGAYVLLISGFSWLIGMGISILMLSLTFL
jgi:hypothetical protein